MKNNKKLLAVFSILFISSLFIHSAAAASIIDKGTTSDYDDKIVWKTYYSKNTVTIYITEYDKKAGKWIFDNKEKVTIKKINKNTLKIITYEHDGDLDIDYKKTKLTAKSYYIKIIKYKLRYDT